MTALGLAFFGVTLASSSEADAPAPLALSTEAIVQNLMAANARRAASLRGYRGKRVYKLDYHGVFGGSAGMQVEATYRAPNQKDFKVVSETGSKLLIRHVLEKLLLSEHDAQEEKSRRDLEITPANYQFHLAGTEHTPEGDFYVLEVKPRSKSKFVYQGKIWVDARDFAMARMEGSPAVNPSFWVSHIDIQYQWAKVDGFWLPIHNHSVTNVRLGGRAVLDIDYSGYQTTRDPMTDVPSPSDKGPTLPDPSSVTVQPH
jgi:outer membrane lipoprotein-sorting protein